MKKADGHYEWNYDAGQCTFCGRCVDSCALKLLTMESSRPPVYEASGALKQSHRWPAKPGATGKPNSAESASDNSTKNKAAEVSK